MMRWLPALRLSAWLPGLALLALVLLPSPSHAENLARINTSAWPAVPAPAASPVRALTAGRWR